jgi:hypothetical protein
MRQQQAVVATLLRHSEIGRRDIAAVAGDHFQTHVPRGGVGETDEKSVAVDVLGPRNRQEALDGAMRAGVSRGRRRVDESGRGKNGRIGAGCT